MSNWTIKEKFNLPDNWEVMRLHDLTTQIVDGTHFTPNYLENGIPFLRVTDIQTKNIDFTGLKFISKEEHELLKIRCSPSKGDILLSKNGSIGIIKIVDWDWEFSIFVSLALIKTKKEIYNQYLKYLLQSEIVWWQIKLRAKQGTVTNLHLEEIRELEVPKPSLPEQRRITQILSTTDAVIEKTQAAIAKYKAIKQGMLHDLFNRGIDLSTNKLRLSYQEAPELYKESKLGWIPKEWELHNFETASELITDFTANGSFETLRLNVKYYYEPNYGRLIRLTDLRVNLKNDGVYVDKEGFEFLTKSSLKENDIMLANVGEYTGYACLMPKVDYPATIAPNMFLIRCNNDLFNPLYMYYFMTLDAFTRQVDNVSASSATKLLNKTNFRALFLTQPEVKEQEIIGMQLKSIDKKIESEQAYLQKLQQIKKGLMEDLLSGKKMVKVPEELETKNES